MTFTHSLTAGESYNIVASGTSNWKTPSPPSGDLGDAEYWLRHDAYGEGWTYMGISSLALFNGAPQVVEWGVYNSRHEYLIIYMLSIN